MKESVRVLGLSLLILISIGLIGCSDDDDGIFIPPIPPLPSPSPTPPPAETFLVRAVHASPDAPTVDVLASGALAFPGLSFFEVAPDAAGSYVTFPAGLVDIGVELTDGTPVIGETFSIPANTNQTIVVTGTVATPFGAEPLDIIAFTDDVIPTSGQSEIRILHLSPDAPAVDVRLPDGTPLVENLAFSNASPQITVPPGVYTVEVFPAGGPTSIFTATLPPVTANNNFTVYAVGLLGDASFTLEVSQDTN